MVRQRKPGLLSPGTQFFVLVASTLLAACGGSQEGGGEPQRPNVVVIVVDTLRADRLAPYGSPVDTAPFVSEIAAQGLVFENAWSPSSWTLPATVSAVTSLHPFQHGVNNLAGLELEPGDEPVPVNVIPDSARTLAEVLRDAGYRTFGVASNVLVGEAIGFDRGFDRFVQLPDEDADAVNAVVEEWQGEIFGGAEPFFLYLHYFDPHDPFHARDPWFDLERSDSAAGWPEVEIPELTGRAAQDLDWLRTRLVPGLPDLEGVASEELAPGDQQRLLHWMRAAYDSEISFVDSRIRRLSLELGFDDAVVVLTADHGEEFYEHGRITHGFNLHAETVRVPLIVRLPGDDGRRGRVADHVSTLDLLPTLRALLDLPPSRRDQGVDLLADLRADPHPPVVSVLASKSERQGAALDQWALLDGDHRLLVGEDGQPELYHLPTDPGELRSVADERPDLLTRLRQLLAALRRDTPEVPPTLRTPPAPTDELREHLEGIGYLN